jgi:hypothetical protein
MWAFARQKVTIKKLFDEICHAPMKDHSSPTDVNIGQLRNAVLRLGENKFSRYLRKRLKVCGFEFRTTQAPKRYGQIERK